MTENNSGAGDSERRDLVDKLRDLAVLRDQGVLNESEFQRAKLQVVTEYRAPRQSGRGMT